jgi:hypothetical protein
MMPLDYLNEVKGAIEEASRQDGHGTPDAESVLANLAARGLIVVEVPVGVHQTFIGIAP